jgi:hypothetical protein
VVLVAEDVADVELKLEVLTEEELVEETPVAEVVPVWDWEVVGPPDAVDVEGEVLVVELVEVVVVEEEARSTAAAAAITIITTMTTTIATLLIASALNGVFFSGLDLGTKFAITIAFI